MFKQQIARQLRPFTGQSIKSNARVFGMNSSHFQPLKFLPFCYSSEISSSLAGPCYTPGLQSLSMALVRWVHCAFSDLSRLGRH